MKIESEELSLLKDAVSEIKSLRHRNELMSARLEMFDSMMLVLNTEPRRQGYGCQQDVVSQIEKFITTNQNKNEEPKTN